MRKRSYYDSILDDIQLDITKPISHVKLERDNLRKQIQEIVDNKDNNPKIKGYCLLTLEGTPLGYITSNKVTTHTRKDSVSQTSEQQLSIAKSLMKFKNKMLSENALKQFIFEESPICDMDVRTIKRIFKAVRKEMDHEVIEYKITLETYYWVNSYITKHLEVDISKTFLDYQDELIEQGVKRLEYDGFLIRSTLN